LKLVKRGENKPHLAIEYPAASSILIHGRVDICHDIPIKLIKVDTNASSNTVAPGAISLDAFFPPQIRTPDICIELVSKIKLLKTIIERLSKFGKVATLSVDGQGKFYVETMSNLVKIKTIVSGLTVSLMQEEGPTVVVHNPEDLENAIDISVRVNLKKLSLLLDFVNTTTFEACSLCKLLFFFNRQMDFFILSLRRFIFISIDIAKNEALILYVMLPQQVGGVTYYMSVLHDEVPLMD
jgi:hypothetical protein